MSKKLIDMTGRRIGYLTVINYAGNELWNCKCDCGNVVQRRGAQLRKTTLSNCGCRRAEISIRNGAANKVNLVGERIGNIRVTKCLGRINGREFFECECDCGSTIQIERRYLVERTKTHCGCQNRKDMTGKKIDMLTVLSFYRIGKHGTAMWRCKCDCGNEKVVDGALLRNGMSTSCGCLQPLVTSLAKKKYNEYSIVGDTVYVTLPNSDHKMMCDIDDWEKLKMYFWRLGKNGYVLTNIGNNGPEYTAFHMNVIKCPNGMVRDHINRNRIDNRKVNLRIVTHEVNARNTSTPRTNTSGYKGVTYSKTDRKFIAQISVGRKTYHLGRFDTAKEAYVARLSGEEKYFGQIYSEIDG